MPALARAFKIYFIWDIDITIFTLLKYHGSCVGFIALKKHMKISLKNKLGLGVNLSYKTRKLKYSFISHR